MKKIFFFLLFFISFEVCSNQLFYSLLLGRSPLAIGSSEQNLTLLVPINAIAGNSINFVFEKEAIISFFRNLLYLFLGLKYSVANLVSSFNYKNKNYFSFEYSLFDFEETIHNKRNCKV